MRSRWADRARVRRVETVLVKAIVLVGLLVANRSALAQEWRDPCDLADPADGRADLVFREAKLSEHGEVLGVFELFNVGFKDTLVIDGSREEGFFEPNNTEISVEFFSTSSGQWTEFSRLQEEDITEDRLKIKPRSSAKFVTDLVTRKTLYETVAEYRILLRLSRPRVCIVSKPFRVALP